MIHDEKTVSAKSPTNVMSPFVTQAACDQVDRHIEINKIMHDDIISGTQAVFERWCARRRQSAEALATLGREALAAKSPQDAMHVWVQWTMGAMDRLLDDAKDQMAAGTSVARHVATSATAIALSSSPGSEKQPAERRNGEISAQARVHH